MPSKNHAPTERSGPQRVSGGVDPEPQGSSADPSTEVIEGPASQDAKAVPDFLLDDKPSILSLKKDDTPNQPTNDLIESNDILVDTIGLIHDGIADQTHYEGFRLTPKMAELWRKVLKFLLRKMPVKDWPIIVCAASLVLAYAMMGIGYMRWKKAAATTEPTRAPDVPAGAA